MSKSSRIFELIVVLNQGELRTVQSLAYEFGVSRRTMLRDLQLLSEIGLPLMAQTGPNGGYQLIRSKMLPPIAFTPEEAVGMITAYEVLSNFPNTPFAHVAMSTITKLRAAFSKDILKSVDQLKHRLCIETPVRSIAIPFLTPLFKAALNGELLEIDYESRSGSSTRLIYPYGISLSNGLWYCPSYCYHREEIVVFRVDRMTRVEVIEDREVLLPENLDVREALARVDGKTAALLPLDIEITAKGCKLIDPHHVLGEWLEINSDGTGKINREIRKEDLSWFASFLMGLGKEVRIKAPNSLIQELKRLAQETLDFY